MPATNYTPIQLYRTATATGTAPVAGNLNFGELAINYNDGGMLLYAKNASGTIIKLMNNPANLLYPRSDGTSGQAVVTNGSGTLSFATISTAAATPTALGTVYGNTPSAGTYGTFLGYQAGNVTTGANNVAIGNQAFLINTTGAANTAVGTVALGSNITGSNNVAVGSGSLYTNTASNNTGIGTDALRLNTTGTSNTAVGFEALKANTTGANNVAVGYAALDACTTGQRNVAVGNDAGGALTTSDGGVFIGHAAGILCTGVGNTFVGGRGSSVGSGGGAGNSATTGTANSFFGANAGADITTGSKNTIVGWYGGNQDGLDIRTASNYAVISDGDGNRLLSTANGYSLALDGGAVPQSGAGITFPATQSASSNANTLDDYEEGTWTTSFTYSNASAATLSAATYTKVGRLVTLSGKISATLTTTNTAISIIFTLPFTQGANLCPSTGLAYHTATATANAGIGFIADETGAAADKAAFGAPASQVTKADNSSFDIQFSYTYEA